MSAYRGGPQTFSIIGLSSKPLQVFGRPEYQCEYYRANNNTSRSIVTAHKILPDWGFGRVYTVVVLNCTFTTTHPSLSVADASAGGKLLLRSTTFINPIPALVEPPHSWDPFQFSSSPKYDYLYCGSPLYGDLSPQRMREWLAYHIRLFGKRSHFVIHDAGGIHSQLLSVFKPWIQLGYVTLHDVTQQERFDGYYHNQFLVLNDCLHRYRFHSNWIFFFDVDEYIYLPSYLSFASVMASFRNFTQFTFAQIPIANNLCLTQDAGITSKYVHFLYSFFINHFFFKFSLLILLNYLLLYFSIAGDIRLPH
ncbi:Galactan beta-1 4-galactosyltransferase GALS2 [Bienertia sinuspersici]